MHFHPLTLWPLVHGGSSDYLGYFFVMLSTGMSHPVFQLPGLVNIQKAIEHGHFIVDLPIKSMVIFNSKLLVYQRV